MKMKTIQCTSLLIAASILLILKRSEANAATQHMRLLLKAPAIDGDDWVGLEKTHSSSINTMSPSPADPTIASMNLTVESKTHNSVRLSWHPPINNTNRSNIHYYTVQYRRHIFLPDEEQFKNSFDWVNYPLPVQAFQTVPTPEIQEVTTLVDDTSEITSGYFWLKLDLPLFDPNNNSILKLESDSITAPIPFNATVDQFQNAFSHVRGIGKLRVYRYEPGLRGTSSLSKRGTYSWRVEFDTSLGHSFPLMEVWKNSLNGVYSGKEVFQGEFVRAVVKRIRASQDATFHSSMNTVVDELQNETIYDFRVCGKNEHDVTLCSEILTNVKTHSHAPTLDIPIPTEFQLNSPYVKLIEGSGRFAANRFDPDYLHDTGKGGSDGQSGVDGLIIIISHDEERRVATRSHFYYSGQPQQFLLAEPPFMPGRDKESPTRFVDVKLWGGGGSGGGAVSSDLDDIRNSSTLNQDNISNGGGGGYVQARIKISYGEILTIKVGRGGRIPGSDTDVDYSRNYEGYQTGGRGGVGVMGYSGGGGGGYSAIFRNGILILGAGGGGGGGSTDYCCAHGGAGGGSYGSDGSSPKTPVFLDHETSLADGTARREFTAEDCYSDDCVDFRDTYGLPAFHTHFDRGFAPNASFDVLATSGRGGEQGLSGGGIPGKSGSYIVFENHISTVAHPGGFGFGGKGADGKEGAGGGGSGFSGGGGGGSASDSSGGGGGSGFVDYSQVYTEKELHRDGSPSRPPPPQIMSISHHAMIITWPSNSDDRRISRHQQARSFEVELSERCSEDFQLVDHIQTGVDHTYMTSTLANLKPDTQYCVQLIAIGEHGRSWRSDTTTIRTIPLPRDEWVKVKPKLDFDFDQNDHDDIFSLCKRYQRPAPRRGHSLTFIDGKVYLFGGLTKLCICDKDNTNCMDKVVHSNEVWSFDVITKVWKYLQPFSWGPLVPAGREQHSASILSNGKMLIIGGRTNDDSGTDMFLRDVWEMDAGQVTRHSIQGIDEQHASSSESLIDGQVSYYSTSVSIHPQPGFREGSLCLKSVSVQVVIQHQCMEQIGYISLHGPESISKGMHLQNEDQTKLFLSSTEFPDECHSLSSNITFTDGAKESILRHSFLLPESGSFQATTPLSTKFSSLNGNWTLGIYDTLKDGLSGSLHGWTLHFETEYCDEGVQWFKLSSNDHRSSYEKKTDMSNEMNVKTSAKTNVKDFTARHSHSSIAVRNNVYVLGGYAKKYHNAELWRFNYNSKTWTRLHTVSYRPKYYGQSAALTPYGLIASGGLKRNEKSELEEDVFQLNLAQNSSSKLEIMSSSSSLTPRKRYFSSISFIHMSDFENAMNQLNFSQSYTVPSILLFGGDANIYRDNYLDDIWSLSLQGTKAYHESILQDQQCKKLLNPSKYENSPWDWSCGELADVNSVSPCHWNDIILMAWCLKQYQSFTSPL